MHGALTMGAFRSRILGVGIASAVLLGCSSGARTPTLEADAGFGGDTGVDAGMPVDVPVGVVTDAADEGIPMADVTLPPGFTVGPHPPLNVVTTQGGITLDHMQLVVVTYADDTRRATAEALGRWIVGSDWLTDVGAEYGIGTGSFLGAVERTDNAPDALTDVDIQTYLATGVQNGSLPVPPGGDTREVLYVVYVPAHTTVTLSAPDGSTQTSCTDFGAYHGEDTVTGVDFAYAVVPACTYPYLTDRTHVESQEVAASHEIIEAALDPRDITDPAYLLPTTALTAWNAIGGELADLCSLPSELVRDDGFALQRVWSNAAAMAGNRDPCVPVPVGTGYYYAVAATNGDTAHTVPGGSVTFNLQAWSTGPVPDWQLAATTTDAVMPTFAYGQPSVNNGQTTTFTVTLPSSAMRGSYVLVYLYSSLSRTNFHVTPLVVFVD